MIRNFYSRLTLSMRSFDCGCTRLVLLAWQMSRALRCCLPTFGYDKWLTVTPVSLSCRKESSITVFSRNQVSLGGGLPPLVLQMRFTSSPSLYGSSILDISFVVPSRIIGLSGATEIRFYFFFIFIFLIL